MEDFYYYLVVYPNDSVDSVGTIYIFYASSDALLNNNIYKTSVIRYFDSYLDQFYCHDTPIDVDLFNENFDNSGSSFSLVYVP